MTTRYLKMMAPLNIIIVLNLHIGINLWQMVDSESLVYNKVLC